MSATVSNPRTRVGSIACCLLVVACLLAGLGCSGESGGAASVEPPQGFCEPNTEPVPPRPTPSPATLPFVRVRGTDLVDADGQRVALRGVNFGNWLLIEPWIARLGAQDLDLFDSEDLLFAKCEELGCTQTLSRSWPLAYLQHFLGLGIAPTIEFLRGETYAHTASGEEEAIRAFWNWYDALPGVYSEQDLWRYLGRRFGWDRAQELERVWRDHWITELDFERLAALGLNLVRLPFWYDWLESDDAAGATFRADGWELLHEVLEWARRHRLYVLLDMHGAPGGQNVEIHSGTSDGNHLWSDERCQAKTARLWQAIATYVEGDPHVVGFDLSNEPMNVFNPIVHRRVLERIYDAIRSVDGDHVILMEDGYLPPPLYPTAKAMGWESYALSIHHYADAKTTTEHVAAFEGTLAAQTVSWDARFGSPLLVGEFSTYANEPYAIEAMRQILALMNARGIHWAPWTWKHWDANSIWGVYHAAPPYEPIDYATLSFAELRERFEGLDSRFFEPNDAYAQVLREQASAPPAPQDLVFE